MCLLLVSVFESCTGKFGETNREPVTDSELLIRLKERQLLLKRRESSLIIHSLSLNNSFMV